MSLGVYSTLFRRQVFNFTTSREHTQKSNSIHHLSAGSSQTQHVSQPDNVDHQTAKPPSLSIHNGRPTTNHRLKECDLPLQGSPHHLSTAPRTRLRMPLLSLPALRCSLGLLQTRRSPHRRRRCDRGICMGQEDAELNRCKHCGCMTHYTVVGETEPRVAVNCRMMERAEFDELESTQSDGE
jgi:hypothetical protein